MINITINNKQALIDADSSFDFIKENDFFGESEGYTFDMNFPLKDCPENVGVFGHICLPCLDKPTELMPCTIQCGELNLKGSIAIMDVSESSVKCQFLEGVDTDETSVRFDEVFINELDLGSYPDLVPIQVSTDARLAIFGNHTFYCYPWASEEYEVVNNAVDYETDATGIKKTKWAEETKTLTWQPELSYIVEKILQGIGFSMDDSMKEFCNNSVLYRKAIVCNTLPPTWYKRDFKDAMPHWSVNEFFEKLGKFLGGVFKFDFIESTVSFLSYDNVAEKAGAYFVDNVLRNYNATVSRDEKDADFLPSKKYRYKDSNADVWKYWCCPEFLKKNVDNYPGQIITYDSWDAARSEIQFRTYYPNFNHRGGFHDNLVYIKDIDTYFLMRANFTHPRAFRYGRNKNEASDSVFAIFVEMTPLNIFGPSINDYKEDDQYEELDFVPVIVDWNNDGKMMILPVGSLDETESELPDGSFNGESGKWSPFEGTSVLFTTDPQFHQGPKGQDLERGEDSGSEHFDRIYIGFKNIHIWDWERQTNSLSFTPDIKIFLDQMIPESIGLMRLNKSLNGVHSSREIDPKVMYSFSFIASKMPDINSVFIIEGKEFICRKLTASFSINGMSEIIKGEFYRILN